MAIFDYKKDTGEASKALYTDAIALAQYIRGASNDLMVSGGGSDTFLFNGAFENDRVEGYSDKDKLVFQGVTGAGQDYNYMAHASVLGNDTLLSLGNDSVTLVGIRLNEIAGTSIFIT